MVIWQGLGDQSGPHTLLQNNFYHVICNKELILYMLHVELQKNDHEQRDKQRVW